jgi:hypothetical protein
LLNATRQVGAAVGVAAMLSIVAAGAIGQTGNAELAGGYRLALLVSAGLAVIGALVSLGLPSEAHAATRRTLTSARRAPTAAAVPTR